jgi:hypothetical protein
MAGKGNIANLKSFSKLYRPSRQSIVDGIKRSLEKKAIKEKILTDLLCSRLESLLTPNQIARLKREYNITQEEGGKELATLYDVWIWKLARNSITDDPRDPAAVLKNILMILRDLDIAPKRTEQSEQLQISFSEEERQF